MNIYISNLHFSISEAELKQLFEQYGKVLSLRLILDKKTKKSKGFAFIEMENDDEAQNSITTLNGKEIRGRIVKLSPAKADLNK
jgi:RNA recognition motif-containing protein